MKRNELRRYARIPLATEVEVTLRGQKLSSRLIACRAVAACHCAIGTAESAELSFEIPPGTRASARALVCWSSEAGKLLGFQLISGPDKLQPIRAWIDDYLGIA